MHFNPADVIFIPLPSTDKIPLLEQRAGNRQIIVDIGCGKGRFLLQMAERNPACFFIGIDILRKRLQKIEQKAKKANLSNIILVNCEAAYCIAYLMPDNAVSTYYAFFPDPWPKRKHAPRRLFSKEILPDIWRTMKENAIIHIATDDNNYYQQILFLFSKSELFLSVAPYFPPQECKSDFELEFETKYKPIFRCSFQKILANKQKK